ncbi:apolipoprotein N-acyltransferase [Sphingomonas immobilis]|uniref:Apolipoprotein N-acyltransferase n=1 Tax=Sphingomonas immobilis TaxID=3063997 RepID=A0ABT9A5M6_9SPHN|nr:apolipoprotein N-acyltransferase [Sphingomonas sp. CA1-15]MDO7844057.1 apolipoprotein N-acyltransferase [Sphingomonas sp. CA1-15]
MIHKIVASALRRPALLSLVLGALAVLGFAPWGWWPVTLACFAVWMWLTHAAPTMRRALWLGWLFGVGHFVFGNIWLAQAFAYQDAMPHWLGLLAPVLPAFYLAIYPMMAAGVAWRFRRERVEGGYVLVFAAVWIATEYLRATVMTGYPWNPLAEIWLPTPFAQLAAVVGTYALSGLAILASGILLGAAGQRGTVLAALVVVALSWTYSYLTYPMFHIGGIPNAPRVMVVQPDLDQEQRPRNDYAETNLRALAKLSGRPGPAPRLIVWPEGALRYFVEEGYPAQYYGPNVPYLTRARIASLLGPDDIVLTGGNALKFDPDGNLKAVTNSIFALDARARVLGRYDKGHLVPFGEYLPARPFLSLFGLQRLVPGDYDFAPGPGPASLALPKFGRVGFQICYEIIFSGSIVDRRQRPAFLFNPSNDSWYSESGPAQNLAQARLRAIEEGLPVIRATPTGISAVIDAQGRVLKSIPWNTAGAIELPIPPAAVPTLFSQLGNAMAAIVAGALLLLAVAIRFARR